MLLSDALKFIGALPPNAIKDVAELIGDLLAGKDHKPSLGRLKGWADAERERRQAVVRALTGGKK